MSDVSERTSTPLETDEVTEEQENQQIAEESLDEEMIADNASESSGSPAEPQEQSVEDVPELAAEAPETPVAPSPPPAPPEATTATTPAPVTPTTPAKPNEKEKPPVDTRTKNQATVEDAIKKQGRHLGRFKDLTLKAEAEKRNIFSAVMNIKYIIHPRPAEFKDGTVWAEFLKICKTLAAASEGGIITGAQIAEACQTHDWKPIQRAKYTLVGTPADGWILSLIQGGPTSKYRILKRVEG